MPNAQLVVVMTSLFLAGGGGDSAGRSSIGSLARLPMLRAKSVQTWRSGSGFTEVE
jgi:hypothetical protein